MYAMKRREFFLFHDFIGGVDNAIFSRTIELDSDILIHWAADLRRNIGRSDVCFSGFEHN